MSDLFDTSIAPAPRSFGLPTWWALVVPLALITIAVALIMLAVNPELDGRVVTAVVAFVILINAAIVSIVLPRIDNLDPALSNDDGAYR